MELPAHTVPKGDVASEDERSPLLGGRQVGWAGKLIHQEVAGAAEMPIRRRPLRQEHATAAAAIHWPGIQAGEGSDGAGAEGIH